MTIIIFFSLIFLIAIVVCVFIRQPKFGKHPVGERLERVKKSPYYRDGSFKNVTPTPQLTEGVTYYKAFKDFFFGKKIRIIPNGQIPSVKTNLLNLDIHKDVLVWFGHSSYFIQIDEKRILVDPVFCGHASPFSFSVKAFKGTDIYTTEEIPSIDYLFITHDHWDHLDEKTIKKIKPKIKTAICSLGTGEHLEYWGYDKSKIIELDWNENVVLDKDFKVNATAARHFSGRTFIRNKALWTSFVLQTPTMKIFLGGDSGYDVHFAEIGKTFDFFDLAILENGQYDWKWKYIHSSPEEVLKAAKDLNAKRIFPVHNSKFALASHPWDEPLEKITTYNKTENLNLITPMIGEQVNLKDNTQIFTEWWKAVK
ncbi:MAG TPA: MBL fold metallo-hydrolase [Chitinophagaceae bacterium]|jgi:L-ascorbate metabolism protein UlaG (beta-lactamase superfamily)